LQQVGHTDPKITLGSYAKVMFRQDGEKDKLRQLIEGVDWAQLALIPTRRRAAAPYRETVWPR
jgi:hypothetical protein